MIQLQFRWCSPSCTSIFLAHTPQVLFGSLVTDGHLPGDGFHWHSGGVELERAPLLIAEGRLVGGVIGGEDVGKAWGDPVPACGDLPDRCLYLAGFLAFHGIA